MSVAIPASPRTPGFETLALHAGYTPEATTGARAVPIYHTASYQFRSADHAADLFALRELGNIYTRITNPTTAVFEARLAALEGGIAGVAAASGQAAEALALTAILRSGDELVASSSLYGGTYNLLKLSLARFGIRTTFVDIHDLDAVRAAITPSTRAIFLESLPNPGLDIPDFDRIADLATAAHLPLIVDNTAATPVLFRPIDHGAHVVVHSATKYIGGHGTAIGGALVDAGTFSWDNGLFPEFTEPHPGYHGLRLFPTVGAPSLAVKARIEGLRDLGAALSPFNAHAFIQGLETLKLRVERHNANALTLARWLTRHPRVAWVRYPGLDDDPARAAADKYFGGRGGGIVTFGVRGGYEAGRRLIDQVRLWSLLANIGDTRSLIIHPASTTHAQLTADEQRSAGVGPELVRLSVGIEDPDDLIEDLDRALLLA